MHTFIRIIYWASLYNSFSSLLFFICSFLTHLHSMDSSTQMKASCSVTCCYCDTPQRRMRMDIECTRESIYTSIYLKWTSVFNSSQTVCFLRFLFAVKVTTKHNRSLTVLLDVLSTNKWLWWHHRISLMSSNSVMFLRVETNLSLIQTFRCKHQTFHILPFNIVIVERHRIAVIVR